MTFYACAGVLLRNYSLACSEMWTRLCLQIVRSGWPSPPTSRMNRAIRCCVLLMVTSRVTSGLIPLLENPSAPQIHTL